MMNLFGNKHGKCQILKLLSLPADRRNFAARVGVNSCRGTDKLSYATGIVAAAIIRPEIIPILSHKDWYEDVRGENDRGNNGLARASHARLPERRKGCVLHSPQG